jgi:hypothetical protein
MCFQRDEPPDYTRVNGCVVQRMRYRTIFRLQQGTGTAVSEKLQVQIDMV